MLLVINDFLTINIDLMQSLEIRGDSSDDYFSIIAVFADWHEKHEKWGGSNMQDSLFLFYGTFDECIEEKKRLEKIIRENGTNVIYAQKTFSTVPHHMRGAGESVPKPTSDPDKPANCRCNTYKYPKLRKGGLGSDSHYDYLEIQDDPIDDWEPPF